MFGINAGTWWYSSSSDPRWDCSGHSEYMSFFVVPEEAERKLEELRNELGEEPEDLEFGCMKD